MGWAYEDWVGPFYQKGLEPGEWLARYARVFDTVEVDSSFYRAPALSLVERWRDVTPDGFRFTLKVPGEITHERKLRDIDAQLASFLATLAPLARAGKLGPLVAQFAPSFARQGNAEALADFLAKIPDDFALAVELRDDSWWTTETFRALESRGASLVWSVQPHATPPPRVTADFLYLRFVGDRALGTFGAIQRDLRSEMLAMKERLEREGADAREVYFLLNNHFMGYAPGTARILQEVMGLPLADLTRAMRAKGQFSLGEF
ncbi:MAG: DUF72 domain-containing protein [Thermoplasmatota archaeon]